MTQEKRLIEMSYEDYCKKYLLDEKEQSSKDRYDTYCRNMQVSDLRQMHRKGDLPEAIFDC